MAKHQKVQVVVGTRFAEDSPNGLRFSGAAAINGNHIVAEIGAEKRTISLDAKRRPLQARVGRQFLQVLSTILCDFFRTHAF
ncbi:hypothetical protein SE17_22250 [Kouleothrix aurantiaca]|uniref:Uncharacterized protein n=1 Tax=Kouleothrix aurantiaca TaxID=186479 RepID=A0A0P9HAB3_9CHLR|nr:hypothetical protein SE17_22250 [Kouleothrix aurantiaca]